MTMEYWGPLRAKCSCSLIFPIEPNGQQRYVTVAGIFKALVYLATEVVNLLSKRGHVTNFVVDWRAWCHLLLLTNGDFTNYFIVSQIFPDVGRRFPTSALDA